MTYTVTQDQKDWLQEWIDIMPTGAHKTAAQNWLNDATTVTDAQLNTLQSVFVDNQSMADECAAFVAWVKGGVRPGHPH